MIRDDEFLVETKIEGRWEGWSRVLYLEMARVIAQRLKNEGKKARIKNAQGKVVR